MSDIKVKPEGATDPLREALERISADILVSERTHRIAREALAAAPEPEWEYRVVSCLGAMASPDGSERTVYHDKAEAASLAAYFSIECHVERRRAAGRPGEWEALPDA